MKGLGREQLIDRCNSADFKEGLESYSLIAWVGFPLQELRELMIYGVGRNFAFSLYLPYFPAYRLTVVTFFPVLPHAQPSEVDPDEVEEEVFENERFQPFR